MAVVLVIGPIFEADMLANQYGFRPELDAKMAVRQVLWHIRQHGRREVVDADLRDYFTAIPHGSLMRCLSRRIADGRLLRIIKGWLTVPVVERAGRRVTRTATARRTKRGTPQGSVISPMLANLYFRRFLLAWRNNGHQDQLDAHVVNYADDFVICCRPGHPETAKTRMEALMTRLGLEVNETKTRLARIPEITLPFSAIRSASSTERRVGPTSERILRGKSSKAVPNGSTIERRDDGMRTTEPPRPPCGRVLIAQFPRDAPELSTLRI